MGVRITSSHPKTLDFTASLEKKTHSAVVHIYPEKDLRAYPGTLRNTDEWNNIYKIRTVVERDINHFKDNLCLAGHRTQNENLFRSFAITYFDLFFYYYLPALKALQDNAQ